MSSCQISHTGHVSGRGTHLQDGRSGTRNRGDVQGIRPLRLTGLTGTGRWFHQQRLWASRSIRRGSSRPPATEPSDPMPFTARQLAALLEPQCQRQHLEGRAWRDSLEDGASASKAVPHHSDGRAIDKVLSLECFCSCSDALHIDLRFTAPVVQPLASNGSVGQCRVHGIPIDVGGCTQVNRESGGLELPDGRRAVPELSAAFVVSPCCSLCAPILIAAHSCGKAQASRGRTQSYITHLGQQVRSSDLVLQGWKTMFD